MRPEAWLAGLLLIGLSTSCGGRAADEADRGKPRAAVSAGAEAAAQDGMCKEHGVLEAICTKCNPRLIPIFKAKGDWCEEHQLPESVCPICHPERGGRPAMDVSGDDAPLDGTKVKLKTGDTARLAGILTVKAIERKGGAGVPALARIVHDATRVAEVNARAPGVIRALKVDVGATVKAGAALAIVDSAEVGADRSRLVSASSRVKIAEENLDRERKLAEEGISARRSVLAAQQELDAARAERAALATSLSIVGAHAGGPGGYTLAAPLAGVVTRRTASVGHLVEAGEALFEVVDTSAVWAEIDVPEADLPAVTVGQEVVLQLDGIAERELRGTLAYIAPEIDAQTRTARARVPLANPDGALRANMFGQARILAAARVGVMVPREAVQRAKSVQLVFVKNGADQFEARRVEVGPGEGDLIEIRKGVRPGEEVATQGSFLLKTETLKESIGAGCCADD